MQIFKTLDENALNNTALNVLSSTKKIDISYIIANLILKKNIIIYFLSLLIDDCILMY